MQIYVSVLHIFFLSAWLFFSVYLDTSNFCTCIFVLVFLYLYIHGTGITFYYLFLFSVCTTPCPPSHLLVLAGPRLATRAILQDIFPPPLPPSTAAPPRHNKITSQRFFSPSSARSHDLLLLSTSFPPSLFLPLHPPPLLGFLELV